MTLTADSSTSPTTSTVTIKGVSDSLSHTITVDLSVTAVKTGTVAVDLSSAYSVKGIYTDGSTFAATASLDSSGFACSEQVLGSTQVWDGVLFKLGPANAPDVVTSRTVALPADKFMSLKMLALGVEGNQESQNFTVTYADGTSSLFTKSLSDWHTPKSFSDESVAVSMPYRLAGDGTKDDRTFHLRGYSFNLDSSKAVRRMTLPDNAEVLVFAITLVPAPESATAR
jgi:hypothetical protein